MKTIAIVPAAGLGLRMGKKEPKQFLLLKGRPILQWTLQALEASPLIEGICLVVSPDRVEKIKKDLLEDSLKVQWVVAGGKERQDSVRNGFREIPACDLVLIHDAVRPLISPKFIESIIKKASETGAAIPGLPVRETLKEGSDKNEVIRTVDRKKFWSIQTPQVFRYEVFKEAVEKSEKDSFLGTDESMLVERIGKKVSLVPGSSYNIKITTPEDLVVAEGLIDAYRDRL
ncbi:MAG: 2-C-methyl-D-erythritol 4-phosphate cytidylyltransferase [bacterium]|nr:2-C-methyl-D-erythritol 4-phosphate cytidylyltransferase [bacterium]